MLNRQHDLLPRCQVGYKCHYKYWSRRWLFLIFLFSFCQISKVMNKIGYIVMTELLKCSIYTLHNTSYNKSVFITLRSFI